MNPMWTPSQSGVDPPDVALDSAPSSKLMAAGLLGCCCCSGDACRHYKDGRIGAQIQAAGSASGLLGFPMRWFNTQRSIIASHLDVVVIMVAIDLGYERLANVVRLAQQGRSKFSWMWPHCGSPWVSAKEPRLPAGGQSGLEVGLTRPPNVADMSTKKASCSHAFLHISSTMDTVDMTPIATPSRPAMRAWSGLRMICRRS